MAEAQGNWRKYTVYIAAWTALGLFNFSRDLMHRLFLHEPARWQELLASWMLGIYITAALAPAILWLGRRWPIERQNWISRGALHLLFAAIFSLVELALEVMTFRLLGLMATQLKGSFWSAFSLMVVIGFHGNVITYGMVIGIQSALRTYREYQERERHAAQLKEQLAQAQLSALKMQLQPHFLFNTLNAITVLVRQQNGRDAEETLARFADLLRCVLKDVAEQEVPLRRELEYLRLYLGIEQVRFSDRLRVEIAADASVLDAAVPHMGLQPIVENAVRHGIGMRAAPGTIHLRAARVDGMLEVQVEDDGPGFSGTETVGDGIGLANTRARLHRLYGERARLVTRNRASGGASVTMALPYREMECN